jgi:DNA-directed RNA polymerase subunit RPC12/RpoP
VAKRKNRPQPGQEPQAQVQVDLSKADTIKCDDCGNYLFIQANVIKRISPIMSPTGQEALVPVQVYSCGNCGKVPKMFVEGAGLGLEEEVNKPKEDSLSRPDLMG